MCERERDKVKSYVYVSHRRRATLKLGESPNKDRRREESSREPERKQVTHTQPHFRTHTDARVCRRANDLVDEDEGASETDLQDALAAVRGGLLSTRFSGVDARLLRLCPHSCLHVGRDTIGHLYRPPLRRGGAVEVGWWRTGSVRQTLLWLRGAVHGLRRRWRAIAVPL